MSDAQKTALRADICMSGLSIAELAGKHGVSKSTVKNFKKDLANQPGQLATLPSTAPIGQVAKAKLTRITLDTQAKRVGLTMTVEEQQNTIQAQMKRGTVDMDLLKAFLATTKTLMDIYRDYDQGEAIARNLAGAGASRTPEECKAEWRTLLEQLLPRLSTGARAEVLALITEEPGAPAPARITNPGPAQAPPIAEVSANPPSLPVPAAAPPEASPSPVEAPSPTPAPSTNPPPTSPDPKETKRGGRRNFYKNLNEKEATWYG